MMTTNLQEMIQPKPNISEASLPEIMDSNYQPATEQALIDYTRQLHNKVEVASIITYWEIGRCINGFYKGKYGARELEKIAKETGIGTNSLHKMCRFARIYTAEQLQSLLKGHYTLNWLDIAQNLAVEPVRVIQTFELSKNYDDFLIQIKRLKDPDEKRGKSRPPNVAEKPEQSNVAPTEAVIPEKAVIAVPVIITDDPAVIEHDEPADDIDPDELTKQYEAYAKELETLRAENEGLKKTISDKDQQISSLNSMMKGDERDIKDKDLIIAAYRDRFKRLRFMIENSFSVGDIMELLVAVE